jgi:hypothetical protein
VQVLSQMWRSIVSSQQALLVAVVVLRKLQGILRSSNFVTAVGQVTPVVTPALARRRSRMPAAVVARESFIYHALYF